MSVVNEGLWSWKQGDNHNNVIELQKRGLLENRPGKVKFEFYGGSAFRLTSPAGVTLLIDPWRNLPGGSEGQFFLHTMPEIKVDIGLSTHAHFDHDALHLLNSNMLLDRIAGVFRFADVAIYGIPDKHIWDFSGCIYDFTRYLRDRGFDPTPPNNPRSFDNNMFVVEMGGMRILHWGDNRPDPPEDVWAQLGRIDVALLPIDGSRHILTYDQAEAVMERVQAKVCIPHHYFTRGLCRIASTLLPADEWVQRQPEHVYLDSAALTLHPNDIADVHGKVLYFGNHLNFELPKAASGLRS